MPVCQQARLALCLLLCIGLAGCARQAPDHVSTCEATSVATGAATSSRPALDRDWKTRDAILGISVDWGKDDSGGTFPLEAVDLGTLQELLARNFIDPADQQNEAPTVSEIIEFMRVYPGTIAFGYAVSPERPDYRVSIDGISITRDMVTEGAREAAVAICHDASDAVFEPDVYCWWD